MTKELEELKNKLETFLQVSLTKKKEEDPRRVVKLSMIDESTIVGEVVSSAFDGKTTSEQQEYFSKLLNQFLKKTGRRKAFSSAVMLYAPEEYRKLGMDSSGHTEKRGTLRSVDMQTTAAEDLYVTLDAKDWMGVTRKISESVDDQYEIVCTVKELDNPHLIPNLDRLIKKNPYKWFDCDGYYFEEIKDIKLVKKLGKDILISFQATSVAPWDLPSSAVAP